MPPSNDSLRGLDDMTREAMLHLVSVMDELTGGAFKRGWREATPTERIREWDSLTPDQLSGLAASQGSEWVIAQQAEIDKLRREVQVV